MSIRSMFARDKKEHLNDPYPGLFQQPHLMDPDFDRDHSLPLIRYRILVDGKEDATGEFHCHSHLTALSETTSMLNRGRYGRLGKYLAEVEVYDAAGKLIEKDRQVRASTYGDPETVHWQTMVEAARRIPQTEARIKAMGPAFAADAD